MSLAGQSEIAIQAHPLSGIAPLPLSRAESIVVGAIVFLLGLHLSMALQRAISWDEFWHYSLLESFLRGDYIQPLQTLYVRAFFWVTYLPGDEIDHIVVVRLLMFVLVAMTALSIAGTVSSLSSRTNGLICAASYLSVGYVLQHATSFRADTMVAALLSGALWIVAAAPLSWRNIAIVGAMVGTAGMITIKAVLWLPAFAGIGLILWQRSNWNAFLAARFAMIGLLAAGTFAAVFVAHSRGLVPDPGATGSALLENSASRMFDPLYTGKLGYLLLAALRALPFAALVIALPFVLMKKRDNLATKIGLLGLWTLAFTTLFYVNSYPYLYTFILPPVAVSLYYAVDAARLRYSEIAIALLLVFNGAANWLVDERGVIANQRQMLTTTKQIFSGPVTYFDCCAAIGSWQSGNGFRTVWGVENYLSSGQPQFRNRMLSEPVPLLIANDQLIENAYATMLGGTRRHEFHPEDESVLRATYIHFWGPLYLAGVELNAFEQRSWNVMVPGIYTVEGAISINGKIYADAETIEIERGGIELKEVVGATARLVWGDKPEIPDFEAPTKVWTSF